MKVRHIIALLLALLTTGAADVHAQDYYPKREFRGAWIQCVNGQFQGLSSEKMKAVLTKQLDMLQEARINAVIFQVRAECDALYKSKLEPWSRFLTGVQGQAPDGGFDPLEFMVEECHKRGMELHAWVNPYRAKTKGTTTLAANHPYVRLKNLFVEYGDQVYLDPGYHESRKYVCKVIRDIVSRYDIDAIHVDDYFYPYPIDGTDFPDTQSFALAGRGFKDKGDWRRDNVSTLVKAIYETVHGCKPWVKFGVSPFGIYRNAKTDAGGSKTNGLQNYDDLYADVLLWINSGWVDYCIPQIYWEIGNKAADYETLVDWWAKNASARPLYIGQDVERTTRFASPENKNENQIRDKYRIQRMYTSVQGSCLWYSAALEKNPGNYTTILKRQINKYPALPPASPFIDDSAPDKVRSVKDVWTEDGYFLTWSAPKIKTAEDEPSYYVVYRFGGKEDVDIEDPSHIVAITRNQVVQLPYEDGKTKYRYAVTALDRLHNESKAVVKKVKL